MNVLLVTGSIVVVGAAVALYPVFKYAPYAYGVARVRAARSRMFSDSELQALAGESYKDAIYNLEKHGLSDMLDLIEKDFREELVQRRLTRDFLEQMDRISRFVPREHKKFFTQLREGSTYDFIVAVIRSKTSQYYDRHTIENVFNQSREFKSSDMEKLEELSLDDFLAKLKGTGYYDLVANHMDDIKAGELVKFEEAVRQSHFEELLSAARDPSLRKYVKMRIDVYNIRHAACFGDAMFINKGLLSEETLKDLESASDVKDIVKALAGTPYGEFTQSASSVIDIEQGLLRAQKQYAKELLRGQPLSVGQMLSYYIYKYIELRNLRILLKLIYVQFKPETIRRMLI